jgi:hypothetical protein
LSDTILPELTRFINTELSAKNKIQEIGSLAIPVLGYIFGTGIKRKYKSWTEKQEKC